MMITKRLQTLYHAAYQPVEIMPLVYFRLLFGAIMIWEVWRYFSKGWIPRYYIDPPLLFTYLGFGWVQPLPAAGMYVVFAALAILAALLVIGLFYRIAALLFFLTFTYISLLDQTRYLNHFYLISLISLIMIILPLHRAFSLDALLRPGIRAERVPLWTLWMLRLHVAIPYVYGGIAKLNADWLQGEPMRHWLIARTDFPLIGTHFAYPYAPYIFSYSGLLLDLFVVFAILYHRTRWLGLFAAISFHLMNARLFSIGIFPWMMIGATLIFLPPAWFRFWQKPTPLPPTDPTIPRNQRPLLGLLAVYLIVQLLFPFRHLLYPGNVNWTEEGHRYAWHMKLRTKSGSLSYLVTDPATRDTWRVDPRGYVTARQYAKLDGHPDMILMFAHYLDHLYTRQGRANLQIRAWAPAALNYRAPQLLIDPTVDLTEVKRGITPASWVLPLEQPLASVSHHTLLIHQTDTALMLINAAAVPFPLAHIQIAGTDTVITGDSLPVTQLAAGECVILTPTTDHTLFAGQCGLNPHLAPLTLPTGDLRVAFDGVQHTDCLDRCLVSIDPIAVFQVRR